MPRMYVAALAHPLSVEYFLLDPLQFALAKDHSAGLDDFLRRAPGLDGDGVRFTSIEALRNYCQENAIEIGGDLHGCLGERGLPRTGNGIR